MGDVVNVLDNLRIPIAASQRLEGVTPYYGANGIQGYIDGFTHDGEFVLVAEDGANDLINYPVQYVSGKVWINNHAHVLQGIKNVANNLFLVYRIKSMDMTKYLVGGGRTKLNASVMKDIELHLPNYAEQTQIGNFFKQLDDTIALHQREFEKFKILRKAYLKHIFIDNTTQFRAEKTIPWEQRKLGDVVEIIGGGTPDTNNTAYWNGNIDWYSPTEIGNKPYVSGSLKKISVLGLQKSSAKILPANKTILFTSRAGIGDMAILTKQGTTNQGFQSFILKNDVDIYFLYSMGFKIKDFALKNASGSTFLEISKSQLSQMKLYLPSLKEQTQIGNFFKQLDDTIALHQKELAKYQQIKTACLEKMFVE